MADSAPRPPGPDSRTIEFWWLHDARWYQGVLRRFGQEIANEINSEAMVFLCRRIAAWFTNKHRLDFRRMPMDEFVRWFGQIPQIMFTDSMMEAEHTPCGPDVWESTIRKNFALRMLRAAGTLDGYDCSCPVMRAGWFAGMGISVSDSLLECQRTGGEVCRFRAVRHNGSESSEARPSTRRREPRGGGADIRASWDKERREHMAHSHDVTMSGDSLAGSTAATSHARHGAHDHARNAIGGGR